MAQLNIRINGYAYTVGCEDGQEAHLQAMAAEVERRIEQVKALGGQSGEARMLVLASLLMADELHDLGAGRARPAAGTAPAPGKTAPGQNAPSPAIADDELNALAERAENIAATLERD